MFAELEPAQRIGAHRLHEQRLGLDACAAAARRLRSATCSGRMPTTTSLPSGSGPRGTGSRSAAIVAEPNRTAGASPAEQSPGRKFIAGEPTKPATNSVSGVSYSVIRRGILLDASAAHDRDARGQRHRLDLVMRDIDDGRAEFLVQALELNAHLGPQLGVQVGQRFIEQEHLGLLHQCSADGDALTLAAG